MYILAIVYRLFEGRMLKQFCIIITFELMLRMFSFRSGVQGILEIVVIIANFHCMLLLFAATHSLITELKV